MKRDMDLIRLLLLALEGDQEAQHRTKAEYEENVVVHHYA